ncbi:MAG: hypothetical protein FJ115_05375 [Deltaproteobacteria bacterium]|nr:hypothetical protein [Deltaproteobacteria bacterium]
MGELAKKALAEIRGNRKGGIDTTLIERTLQEINSDYPAGLLAWIQKEKPEDWQRTMDIEGRINKAALSGNREALTSALDDYKGFFTAVSKDYRETERQRPGEYQRSHDVTVAPTLSELGITKRERRIEEF